MTEEKGERRGSTPLWLHPNSNICVEGQRVGIASTVEKYSCSREGTGTVEGSSAEAGNPVAALRAANTSLVAVRAEAYLREMTRK
jgi:hypothetical protein